MLSEVEESTLENEGIAVCLNDLTVPFLPTDSISPTTSNPQQSVDVHNVSGFDAVNVQSNYLNGLRKADYLTNQ